VCVRLQAKFWCTTSSAKKVTVGLTAVALTTTTIGRLCYHLAGVADIMIINNTTVNTIPPVAVLVINVVVVVQVRRAACNAAANLGVQPHHQSTPNNSAVPTVMLVATSLIYALIYGTCGILWAVVYWAGRSLRESHYEIYNVILKIYFISSALVNFVFAYNFYVYLITGKRFRSELRDLFRRCLSSSSSSAPAAAAAAAI